MITIRDGKKILTTPLSAEEIETLHAGDIVFLDGTLVTGRDSVHHRVEAQKQPLPVDLHGNAVFHAGPIVRKNESGKYEMLAAGPTTSMRMELFEKDFIAETGVRVIIGKGGMGKQTEEACKMYKAVHCIFPAGCGVLAAERLPEITGQYWEDLGMPEMLWCCEAREFGPLMVSIDTHGNNVFENNKVIFNERKEKALTEISRHLNFMK